MTTSKLEQRLSSGDVTKHDILFIIALTVQEVLDLNMAKILEQRSKNDPDCVMRFAEYIFDDVTAFCATTKIVSRVE